jgi:PAS domain S-box-containing protein
MAKLKIQGLSIGQKVLLINSILIVFFALSTVESIVKLTKNKNLVNYSFHVLTPSVEVINNFILITTRSKMYITNWVYLPNNARDKARLRELHNSQDYGYPKIIQELSLLKKDWKNRQNIAEIDSIVDKFNIIIRYEEDIMTQLQTEQDYNNSAKTQKATEIIEGYIIPNSYELIDRLQRLADTKVKEKQEAAVNINDSLIELRNVIILLTVLLILVGIISARYFSLSIGKSIEYLTLLMRKLARGEVPKDYRKQFKYRKDELGMMLQAMHRLIKGFNRTASFATKIGKGEYDVAYKTLSEDDQVGNALLSMRNNLAKASQENKKRNWTNRGISYFDTVLKSTYKNTGDFSQNLIVELVKYLKANQGAVFLINQHKKASEEEYMELTACYAWDKVKSLEKKIYQGEGLAGQVWQEGNTVYIDDVPSSYVNIASGLGKAKPTHILIVPLKGNKKTYGVVEVALFENLEPYKIAFVEKIAQNFALTLSSVRMAEKSQTLLIENAETKLALDEKTQENKQFQQEINMLGDNLNGLKVDYQSYTEAIDSFLGVIEMDKNQTILSVNDKYLEFSFYNYQDLLTKNHKKLIKAGYETSNSYLDIWDSLAKGLKVNKTFERKNARGGTFYLEGVYHPILNQNKELERIIGIFSLISESRHKEKRNRRHRNYLA